jgi:hypothetical protein
MAASQAAIASSRSVVYLAPIEVASARAFLVRVAHDGGVEVLDGTGDPTVVDAHDAGADDGEVRHSRPPGWR